MTRDALEKGFETYVSDIISTAYEQFDVTAAFGTGTTASGRLVSQLVKNNALLDRKVVQPALESYETDVLDQVQVLLDYAEAPDADFADYSDEALSHDTFYQQLREDLPAERKREIRDELVEQQRRLAAAARPIVEADEDEFWPAVEATLSRDEAESLVTEHFAFTDPLRDHPDAFRFTETVNPAKLLAGPLTLGMPTPSLTLDYTDEVRRVLTEAEQDTIERVLDEIDRRYE
ncbi:hypothetical protein ACFR9U_10155 [Halorientalis brevis]|uniref:Uncharacterized protein n=1 Tax=Halorientalis brevis TaxID=1126241 RepID=A0ABD6CD44_9EURY|nr:hypothetical protein [Halorientalis brevis]